MKHSSICSPVPNESIPQIDTPYFKEMARVAIINRCTKESQISFAERFLVTGGVSVVVTGLCSFVVFWTVWQPLTNVQQAQAREIVETAATNNNYVSDFQQQRMSKVAGCDVEKTLEQARRADTIRFIGVQPVQQVYKSRVTRSQFGGDAVLNTIIERPLLVPQSHTVSIVEFTTPEGHEVILGFNKANMLIFHQVASDSASSQLSI